MEIKIERGGVRLDKALSDLTELSRSLANEQMLMRLVLDSWIATALTESPLFH